MIAKQTYQFLKDLKENNNREWFTTNKPRFEEAKEDFQNVISQLIFQIANFDPVIGELEAKKCMHRIYRDTRFSKDKTPYKTNLGAHLTAYGHKPHERAGYYIHLEPGNTFLAGGAYLPPAPWLKEIRLAIHKNGKELIKILNGADFKKYFGEMEGEQLKTKPKDYSEDHPFIDLLKYKSFLAVHKISDKDAMSENFLKHSAQVFAALKVFDDFFNDSIS